MVDEDDAPYRGMHKRIEEGPARKSQRSRRAMPRDDNMTVELRGERQRAQREVEINDFTQNEVCAVCRDPEDGEGPMQLFICRGACDDVWKRGG